MVEEEGVEDTTEIMVEEAGVEDIIEAMTKDITEIMEAGAINQLPE
jgi:hypothetical protein